MNDIDTDTAQTETTQETTRVPWTILDALLAVTLFIVLQVAGAFLIVALRDVSPQFGSAIGLLAIYVLMLVYLWYLVIKRRGASWHDLGVRNFNVWGGIGTAIGIYFILVVALAIYAAIAQRFGLEQPQDTVRQIVQLFGKDAVGFVLAVVFVALIAPVMEELFFRGLVYPAFRQRFGVIAAMLMSSLLFAVLHASAFNLIPIAFIGIALAYLYEKTGSLGPPIILHALNNFLSVILVYYSGILPING